MRNAQHYAPPHHARKQGTVETLLHPPAPPRSYNAKRRDSTTHIVVSQRGDPGRYGSYGSAVARSEASHVGSQTVGRQVKQIQVDRALADKLNEFIPPTRRSIRLAAKAQRRRSHLLATTSLAALVGTAATAMAFANPRQDATSTDESVSTAMQLRRTASTNISRSSDRQALQTSATVPTEQTTSTGYWKLVGSTDTVEVNSLFRSKASNPQVALWLEEDAPYLPSGFNPDHSAGDYGSSYEYSQCTWWVYLRRHQLGLPVGTHMGNGNMWANSARERGFWVDRTARHVGDILVFAAGQYGSDEAYGHVAIVEKINADGSVETSESGVKFAGKTFSRTFTADQVATLQVIHY